MSLNMNRTGDSRMLADNLTKITTNMSASEEDVASRSGFLIHGYHPLTAWEKLFMMSGGGFFVCVTLLVVVCLVFPICWCHRQCCPDEQVSPEMKVGQRKKTKKSSASNGHHLSLGREKDGKQKAYKAPGTHVPNNNNTLSPSNYATEGRHPVQRQSPRTPKLMKRVSMSHIPQQHDFDPTSWLSHSNHPAQPRPPHPTPNPRGETAALGFSTAYGTRSYGSLQQLIHAEAALTASQRSLGNGACLDPAEARQNQNGPNHFLLPKGVNRENGLQANPKHTHVGTDVRWEEGQRDVGENQLREEQQASSTLRGGAERGGEGGGEGGAEGRRGKGEGGGSKARNSNGDPTNSPLVPLTQDEYEVVAAARNSHPPTVKATAPAAPTTTNNTSIVRRPQEEEKLQRGISSSRSGSLETDEGTTTTTTTDSVEGEARPDCDSGFNRNSAHQAHSRIDQGAAPSQFRSGPTSHQDSSHGSIMSLGSSSILTRPTTTSTGSVPVHAKTRRASSPTSIMSLGSTLSALSFGKSPTATNSTPQSPTRMIRSFSREKNVLSSVTFSIHLEHDPQDETNGILTITIESAKDLPLRDYGAPCDVMVHVSLHRDRRSLRKRSRHVFADFKTDVVKQDQNPSFGQSFKTNVPWSDYKNLRMKLSAFDHDRHSKVTEIGTTSLYLKEIKHLNTSAEGLIMTNFLAQKKQEYGELMFGMSYLPTAQRLSFSIMKATNLKYEEIVSNLDDFVPYVRILQLSASGKVVKKKKTSIRPGTKEPAFNETLNFDLNPHQLESTAFMVLLSHKQTSFELQDMDSSSFPETQLPLSERSDSGMSPSPIPSPRPDESAYTQGPTNGHSHGHVHYRLRHRHQGKDLCLGRIVMGSFVRGERERGHWASVIATPRKVFTMWQTLY